MFISYFILRSNRKTSKIQLNKTDKEAIQVYCGQNDFFFARKERFPKGGYVMSAVAKTSKILIYIYGIAVTLNNAIRRLI